jgi:hypothetical protein
MAMLIRTASKVSCAIIQSRENKRKGDKQYGKEVKSYIWR